MKNYFINIRGKYQSHENNTKILFSIVEKRGFSVLSEDFFPSIGKLLKRSSNKGVTKLVPYRPGMKQQSIFIGTESMENSTLKTIENMIDESNECRSTK